METFKTNTQKKIDQRYDANCEIINKLLAFATAHPDWRFHQLLQNCKIDLPDSTSNVMTGNLHMVDLWHEESVDTLDRVRMAYNQFMLNQNYEDKRKEAGVTATGSGSPGTSGL